MTTIIPIWDGYVITAQTLKKKQLCAGERYLATTLLKTNLPSNIPIKNREIEIHLTSLNQLFAPPGPHLHLHLALHSPPRKKEKSQKRTVLLVFFCFVFLSYSLISFPHLIIPSPHTSRPGIILSFESALISTSGLRTNSLVRSPHFNTFQTVSH